MDYYLNALQCCKKAENEGFACTIKINRSVLNILYGRFEDALGLLHDALGYYENHPELPNYNEYMIGINVK